MPPDYPVGRRAVEFDGLLSAAGAASDAPA